MGNCVPIKSKIFKSSSNTDSGPKRITEKSSSAFMQTKDVNFISINNNTDAEQEDKKNQMQIDYQADLKNHIPVAAGQDMPSGDTQDKFERSLEEIYKDGWANAINMYLTLGTKKEQDYQVAVEVVIDHSGSMHGGKLNAVKLGLCALAAQLAPTDFISITKFSTSVIAVTSGFVQVCYLKEILPQLLNAIKAENDTAIYDAVLHGLQSLDAFPNTSNNLRKILIALTDGEDNRSYNSIDSVTERLEMPNINNFMFILMAVGMNNLVRRRYNNWMKPKHCKQLNIDIRTGAKLVSTFHNGIIDRILTEDVDKFAVMDDYGHCKVKQRTRNDSFACSDICSETPPMDHGAGSPRNLSRSSSFVSTDDGQCLPLGCVQGIPLSSED